MEGSRASCSPAKGKNAKGIGKGVADGTALPVARGVMVGGSEGAQQPQFPVQLGHMAPESPSCTLFYTCLTHPLQTMLQRALQWPATLDCLSTFGGGSE